MFTGAKVDSHSIQRVAIVASRLSFGGGAVVGVETIRAAANLVPGGRLAVVHPRDHRYAEFSSLGNDRLVCPPLGHVSQYVWDRTVLRSFLNRFQPDWVWSIGNYAIPGPWRQSLFVHDAHLIYPREKRLNGSLRERIKKALGRQALRRSLTKVVSAYAQTSAIARRLEAVYGLPDNSVRLFRPGMVEQHEAGQGLDRSLIPADVLRRIRGADLVLFYPARGYAHKNHESIMKSIREFPSDYDGVLLLTTVGVGDSDAGDRLLEHVSNPCLRDVWLNLGPITAAQVDALYRLSDALLMPTRLETYGLPFIEAMQRGVPVLAPRHDFVEAVCGAAAHYMPADVSPRDIRDAVVFVRSRSREVAALIARGLEKVSRLPTWRESVRGVLDMECVELRASRSRQ